MSRIEELAGAIEAELLARLTDTITGPEALAVRQAALACAALCYVREQPASTTLTADQATMTANLLAFVPTVAMVVGDLQGTAFLNILDRGGRG